MPRALTLALLALLVLPAAARATSLVEVPVDGKAGIAALERIGADLTHQAEAGSAQVVVHDADDAQALRDAGFTPRTLVEDMEADTVRAARSGARLGKSNLPTQRSTYRVLDDYRVEMINLAAEHPGLVRRFKVGTSVQGRDIYGLEIAKDVNVEDDGRPVYAIYGLHHAREWPSGEIAMEFAQDLATGFGINAEVTEVLDDVRIVIVPVVNPDGFVQSRGEVPTAAAGPIEFKRKNCGAVDSCPDSNGVDLNRNYGAGWGGSNSGNPGSADAGDATYRGATPFSEPESQAIHALSQTRQMTNVQSLHTFGAEILRPPGFTNKGTFAPDEAGLKALGDALAGATGYASKLGHQLYSVYGAAEDWNYASQGAFGYTVEISPPGLMSPTFHGNYTSYVVNQYLGPDGSGDEIGMRWALLLAADQAADEADHSVLTGDAEPGTKLKVRRSFKTETFCQGVLPGCEGTTGPFLALDDFVETSLTVPASGRFTWHVGPSTRPWAGQAEAWTFQCFRADGSLLAERLVTVGRGQSVNVTGCEPPKKEETPVTKTTETTIVEQAPVTQTTTSGAGQRLNPSGLPAMPKLSAATVRVRRSSLRRRRSIAVPLEASGGALHALAVRLRDSRGRLLGQRAFTRLDGKLTLRVRLRRMPRAGTYRVTVTGMTAGGLLLRATTRLVVR